MTIIDSIEEYPIVSPTVDETFNRIISEAKNAAPCQAPVSLGNAALLITAGALPVCSIPLYVFGLLSMTAAALFLVIPFGITAAMLVFREKSSESTWARQGFLAGLAAVTAYDTARMPLVVTKIWPDFIPRLGGWVLHGTTSNIPVGYLWRYIGDGGGIGMVFFVMCGLALRFRPALVTSRPIVLAIGYGVFVWSGLVATIALSARGAILLFPLTPATLSLSLGGHVIYGFVLGRFLRRRIALQPSESALLSSGSSRAVAGYRRVDARKSLSYAE